MTPSELAPAHPYRVTRRTDLSGRPLKGPQHRVLEALVGLCPEPGQDATARAVAELADQKVGAAVVVLKSLEKLRFVMRFDHDEGQAIAWTPTLTGRNRIG